MSEFAEYINDMPADLKQKIKDHFQKEYGEQDIKNLLVKYKSEYQQRQARFINDLIKNGFLKVIKSNQYDMRVLN